MDEITIWVTINSEDYEFQVDADEWSRMTDAEKREVLDDCEMEARDMYCGPRTTVLAVRPDGTEEEI